MYRLKFYRVGSATPIEEEYSSVGALLAREEELTAMISNGREEYNNFSMVRIAR